MLEIRDDYLNNVELNEFILPYKMNCLFVPFK